MSPQENHQVVMLHAQSLLAAGRHDEAMRLLLAAGGQPVMHQDPHSAAMFDFSLPRTEEELREYSRRRAAREREDHRLAWRATPAWQKAFTVVFIAIWLTFVVTMVSWGLTTLATS